MNYAAIQVQPLPKHSYKVLKAIKYRDITIPAGYVTNGADIPRIFWSLIPPNKSDLLPAVIVHDYMCDLGDYEKADRYFKEVLMIYRINKTEAWVLHTAVSLYTKLVRPLQRRKK